MQADHQENEFDLYSAQLQFLVSVNRLLNLADRLRADQEQLLRLIRKESPQPKSGESND